MRVARRKCVAVRTLQWPETASTSANMRSAVSILARCTINTTRELCARTTSREEDVYVYEAVHLHESTSVRSGRAASVDDAVKQQRRPRVLHASAHLGLLYGLKRKEAAAAAGNTAPLSQCSRLARIPSSCSRRATGRDEGRREEEQARRDLLHVYSTVHVRRAARDAALRVVCGAPRDSVSDFASLRFGLGFTALRRCVCRRERDCARATHWRVDETASGGGGCGEEEEERRAAGRMMKKRGLKRARAEQKATPTRCVS